MRKEDGFEISRYRGLYICMAMDGQPIDIGWSFVHYKCTYSEIQSTSPIFVDSDMLTGRNYMVRSSKLVLLTANQCVLVL